MFAHDQSPSTPLAARLEMEYGSGFGGGFEDAGGGSRGDADGDGGTGGDGSAGTGGSGSGGYDSAGPGRGGTPSRASRRRRRRPGGAARRRTSPPRIPPPTAPTGTEFSQPARPRDPDAHGFRVGGVVIAAVVIGVVAWIGIIMCGIAIYHAFAH